MGQDFLENSNYVLEDPKMSASPFVNNRKRTKKSSTLETYMYCTRKDQLSRPYMQLLLSPTVDSSLPLEVTGAEAAPFLPFTD